MRTLSAMMEERFVVPKLSGTRFLDNSGSGSPFPTQQHDAKYYAKCMIGGALSCGLTHTAIVPLDVTKCKMQVFPTRYPGLRRGFARILAEEGASGLTLGWAPTFMGYSAQGLYKFGLYEVFKDVYGQLVGHERMNEGGWKGPIWLAASASAEFVADVALCPMEMVKVKMQTSPPGTWPRAFGPALSQMSRMRREVKFPFGSLRPLWSRQIPYTMAKFYCFERTVEIVYNRLLTRKPKDAYSKGVQLAVTFASGYIAGVVCAVVSHPADSLVSQMGKTENQGKTLYQITSNLGLRRLCTTGLGTRIVMIGTLTGLQWWIYDAWKTLMGMETTGGAMSRKM